MPRDAPALRPQPARPGPDWWRTPRCLTSALLHFVLPELPGAVWECAAGDGVLLDAMRAVGRDVLGSDLYPRAHGIRRLDFLQEPPPCPGRIAVTNPPYNQLDAFIVRGMQLLDRGDITALVLLLRSDAPFAASRAAALNRADRLWHCCWRPIWIPGTKGGGRWPNIWLVWRAGRPGPPVTTHLRPGDVAAADLFHDEVEEAEP